MHVVGMPANGGHWRAFRRLAAGTQVKKAMPALTPGTRGWVLPGFFGQNPQNSQGQATWPTCLPNDTEI